MKHVFSNQKHLILIALLGFVIIAAAWQTDNKQKKDTTGRNNYATGDTTQPKGRNNDNDDLDKAMNELNEQMLKFELQMKDLKINISKQVQDAISQIDMEKINKQIQDEMKNVDMDKIKMQIDEQMKNVDLDKIKMQIDEQMKNIDMDKIKSEIDKSMKDAQEQMKNIDMDKLNEQMKELKNNLNSDELKKEIDKSMKGAQESLEKAQKELQDLKDFTDQLEKDGLIDKKKGYSIEWKNGGELYINGKKQPKEISDKYKKYYKKDGWKIEMNGEGKNGGEFM